MLVTDMLGKVDIKGEVVQTLGGSPKGEGNKTHGHIVVPRAVRTGAALGIAALYPEHKGTLRLGNTLLVYKIQEAG